MCLSHLNPSAVLPDITTSLIEHTNDVSLPTAVRTTDIVSATGQMPNMSLNEYTMFTIFL